MDEDTQELKQTIKIAAIAGGIAVLLIIITLLWMAWSKKKEGTVVLPAGNTYLGDTPAAQQAPQAAPEVPRFSAGSNEEWITYRGKIYPYSFKAPKSLELAAVADNPYDIYAISFGGVTPGSNVLIGVDNLAKNEKFKEYVETAKRGYAENWWKQFALTGVSTLTEFTTKQGYKGYKVKYAKGNVLSQYDDVFLEIPSKPEIVIHMSNLNLEHTVFDQIVDSVTWTDVSVAPSPTAQ